MARFWPLFYFCVTGRDCDCGGLGTQYSPAMTYQPRPLDTAHVTLPTGLDELLEFLAENMHDQ